jgi:MFS transporter, FSR family, fosmidomycin resistance protein
MRSTRDLRLLMGSHAVDDFYQGAVPALVALLVTSRSYGYAAASGITLAATLLSSVVQPLFGILTDRRELRWLVPVGMSVAGLGIGLCGVVDNYAWTWGCVALSGLGVAAYHPQAASSAGQASAGSAAGMSWFTLGGNLGYAAGPVVTTPLLLAAGLTGTPLLALPALAYAAVLAVHLRRPDPPVAAPTDDSPPVPVGVDRWRAFARLTAVVSVRSVFFFGISSFLALYLLDRLHTGPSTAAAIVTVLLAAGVVGTLLGGRLADRFGRVRAMQAGYLLSVPGLIGLLLARDLASALLSVALLGIAIYLPVSVQVTLGQEYLPNRVGTASGVTLGLAVSAGGIAAPLLGLFADAHGLPLTLSLLLVLPVVTLLLTRRLPEIPRDAGSPPRHGPSARPAPRRRRSARSPVADRRIRR